MNFKEYSIDIESLYRAYLECGMEVTTDSRRVPEGALFFALKGDNFDGNSYALSALEQGAKYAVVSRPELPNEDSRCLYVADTLPALQLLAHHHRMQRQDIPVIGITGTNGKTTTKELMANCLSQAWDVLYTQGNLNNHIGVPLTLLRLRTHHKAAIVEMGASHPGDIEELCNIACPTTGVITNVGKAHLEGFGSVEGVLKTKSELFRHLVNNGKSFILNRDDQYLSKKWRKGYDQSFGLQALSGKGYMRGSVLSSSPFLSMIIQFEGKEYRVATHLVGEYNAHNILAAMSAATSVGLDIESCIKGVEEYCPANHRSQLIEGSKGRCIIADAYNANPSSMMVALRNLAHTEGEHRIAILGDMRELGAESLGEHQAIVEWLAEHSEIEVYLVGAEFGKVASPLMSHYTDASEIMEYLTKAQPFEPYSVVLLKGSHGMALQQLLPTLQKLIGKEVHGT
ncbi:MAG: UDP-N-acetylmuramoyl-tripeptide--D-alanyl-D-alanine ligase [Bacteroidales bacterium]|uniref:UDP-N-acetylmuramoyl-tripeptide--D-alanyl-D- alanine ligase n=1 Tax=Porphyromonas sp. TaxID=1924944 RepID=UPI002972A83B|nr:UDP-N-acetylmuramoyl-tripeptide--D-alanyl-D-alanine ligase [Porphyromonas sp.]MDD7438348.1 UDP-N-acetylmuramoyl-tripeptide--D-alanyl-D-alanine ligase [Bacteroidales bacterium]MDY3066774.1 UDP-N-acetylmuramoyl-tripeptide--D-alanyl-D-alanine ligase [Porphyromonas sp.]